MGIFKRVLAALGLAKKNVHILIVGLDNSGKTTLINWLKPKKQASLEVVPTVGFNVEEFSRQNINFTVFDMSGQGRYRNLWEHYYKEAEGVVFVIDATDKIRFAVAKNELDNVLSHPDLACRKIPVVFFANKMDLPGSASPVECMQALELESISDRAWNITASNAISGEGVEEGLRWLVDHMLSRQ